MSDARTSYAFEALGDHDRESFCSGVSELDDYLRRQAGQDARRKVAAPFVMVDSAHRIVGYYTLSAYTVCVTDLAPERAKKFPKYPLIPATLLGRLAIDRVYRGQKLGTLLLMDALHRSWRGSKEIASVGVVTEALNEAAREFYLHHGFAPFAEHPRKLLIPMETVQKAFR